MRIRSLPALSSAGRTFGPILIALLLGSTACSESSSDEVQATRAIAATWLRPGYTWGDSIASITEVQGTRRDTHIAGLVIDGHRGVEGILEGCRNLSKLEEVRLAAWQKGVNVSPQVLSALSAAPSLKRLTIGAGYRVPSDALNSLAKSTSLRELNLVEVSISDDAFTVPKAMPRLERVSLISVPVTKIAVGRLSTLDTITHLQLALGDNAVSNECLDELVKFKNLRSFELFMAVDDAVVEKTSRCRNLQSVVVGAGNVSTAAARSLAELPELSSLNVMQLEFSDATLAKFCAIPKLNELHVTMRPDGPTNSSPLFDCKGLTTLRIAQEDGVDGDLLGIGRLAALRDLNVGDANVSSAELTAIAGLSQLKRLVLNTAQFKTGMSPLESLTQLEVLEVGWSNAQDADLKVVAKMQSLRELRMQQCQVTDAGVRNLESCRKLERLDLSNTQLQGTGLVCLKQMPSLRECSLKNTKLDDDAIGLIAAAKGLVQLDLSGTSITDEGLKKLKALQHLRVLSVTRTRCTPRGIQELQQAIPHLIVGFSHSNEHAAGSAALNP